MSKRKVYILCVHTTYNMKKKTLILYNLKGKNQVQKVQALRKLYGYDDKSNYKYNYKRKGALNNLQLKREKKTVITLDNEKDLAKITQTLKELNINFDIATLR